MMMELGASLYQTPQMAMVQILPNETELALIFMSFGVAPDRRSIGELLDDVIDIDGSLLPKGAEELMNMKPSIWVPIVDCLILTHIKAGKVLRASTAFGKAIHKLTVSRRDERTVACARKKWFASASNALGVALTQNGLIALIAERMDGIPQRV